MVDTFNAFRIRSPRWQAGSSMVAHGQESGAENTMAVSHFSKTFSRCQPPCAKSPGVLEDQSQPLSFENSGGVKKHSPESSRSHSFRLVSGRNGSRVGDGLEFSQRQIGEIKGDAGQLQGGVVFGETSFRKIYPYYITALHSPSLSSNVPRWR